MSKVHPSLPTPETIGLPDILARALRTPFHRRRGTAGGWTPGTPLTWDDWHQVSTMSKEELRAIPDLDREFCLVDRRDVVGVWRSGGVTGRPVFYPRTADDLAASLDAFARTLSAAGVTADDVVHVSLPIGIHPAGQQLARAAESLGATVVWAGGGTQTSTAEQVRLIGDLGVTVWVGMPAFGLTLAQLAADGGQPFADGRVRLLITTAEHLSNARRARLRALWGADVVDVFGMSEATLLGLECPAQRGFHIWNDVAYCEVVDAETRQPVPDGEPGVLCVTPLRTGNATPFVRWLSGDVVRLRRDCDCVLAEHPLVHHTGRLQSFFKVRGINVGHDELESLLLGHQAVADFFVVARNGAELEIQIESRSAGDGLCDELSESVRHAFGLRPLVRTVADGTVAQRVAGQIKAQRFVTEVEHDAAVAS